MRTLRALAALHAASALAHAAGVGDGGGSPASDEMSCLQSTRAPQSGRGRQESEATLAQSDEVHIVFTVDCGPYNLWQSELLFFSAQRVGQRGPITQIISGCMPEERPAIEERHASLGLSPQHTQVFVPEYNDARSFVINKPYGVQAWLRQAGAQREVVAVIDPDFVFIRPLTPDIDGADAALGWPNSTGPPRRVVKGLVAGQRWGIFAHPTNAVSQYLPDTDRNFTNMTESEFFTWICTGSPTAKSGCTNITKKEVGYFHATGVPYMAHREDWEEWLADSWADITGRFHQVFDGYIVEMLTWSFANIHRGKRELVVRNLQMCSPGYPEDWRVVDNSTIDPCTEPMERVLGDPMLGHFLHYTMRSNVWDKRWFQSEEMPHVLARCDAAAAQDPGLQQLVTAEVDKNMTRRWKWHSCVSRRFFAAGLKRTCAGQPVAALVEKISAGFSL